MTKNTKNTLIIGLLTATLAACGGADSGSDSNDTVIVQAPEESCMNAASYNFGTGGENVPYSEVDTDKDGCVTREEWQAAYDRAHDKLFDDEIKDDEDSGMVASSSSILNQVTADSLVYAHITEMTITGNEEVVTDEETGVVSAQVAPGEFEINVKLDMDQTWWDESSTPYIRIVLTEQTADDLITNGGMTGSHLLSDPTGNITMKCSYVDLDNITCEDFDYDQGRFNGLATPATLHWSVLACNNFECSGSRASVSTTFKNPL